MKISDFLRLRITPDNKQFDTIKNIRFYDDKELLLVGKGTTSVQSFCEQFFDYVYRNYSSSRAAEKLVKSNRKKYTKFSSSENMALVQRILNEICNDYAITNYNITCEVDNGNAKKPTNAPAAQVLKATPKPEVKQENTPAAAANTNGNGNVTVKLKALESELGRLSGEEKKQAEPVVDISGIEEPYIHPEIKKEAENKPQAQVKPQNQPQVQNQAQPQAQTKVQPQAQQQTKVQPQAQVQPQAKTQPQVQVQAQTQPQVQPQAQAQPQPQVQPQAQAQPQTKPQTQAQPQKQAAEPVQAADQSQNQPQNQTQNQAKVQQQQGKNKHDKKHGKKQEIPDARIKPGKGYKPFKPNEHLKEAAKFQAADNTKSNLKIEDIPCIAVIEEDIIPTIDEVPFIGVPEDNSIPSVSSVPFVGVEDVEAGKPIPDVPYIGEEDGEAGKPIPDVPYIGAEDGEKGKPIPNVPYLGAGDYMDSALVEPSNFVAIPEERKTVHVNDVGEIIVEDEFLDETPATPAVYDTQETDDEQDPADVEEVTEEQEIPEVQESTAATETVYEPEAAEIAETIEELVEAVPVKEPEPIVVQPVSKPATVEKPAKQTKKNAVKPVVQKDVRQLISSYIRKYNQVVFTGPSGTGKTYQVRKFARKNTKGYDGFKFVQFHPSYEYSDFIEGLRPVNIINTTSATNVRIDGVFKAFCRMIVEDNLEHAVPGFASIYSEKKQKVVQEFYEKIRDKKEALEDGSELRDFAMDSPEYIFDHGVREYYFVIDELNRADAARVFGDVLFALDEDYRGIENRFDTRLGNLKTYRIIQAEDMGKSNYSTSHIGYAEQMKFDCFEKGFFIPRNLHIIGTMNELGGTVDDIDFSLKQKFKWVNINPSEIMKSSLNEMLKDKDIFWLDQFANNLNLVNRLIGDGFSDEYCLGPAFFRKLDESPESIDEVFDMDVEPVLKEYLKGKPADITERFISECRKALKLGI